MSQATISKSILSQRTKTPCQSRAKNSQKEESTLVIQSENVCHSLLFSPLYCLQSLHQRRARCRPCSDLQNSQGSGTQNSLHCEKSDAPYPLISYYILTITHRVSQKNTQNGPLVPPFPLNTILTINFATQPTGTRQISALNGP